MNKLVLIVGKDPRKPGGSSPVAEAMLCGLPVVGPDSGAIRQVFGDAGLIFPEGDGAALVASLQRLQSNTSLWRELAERGYQRAFKSFSVALADGFHPFCLGL